MEKLINPTSLSCFFSKQISSDQYELVANKEQLEIKIKKKMLQLPTLTSSAPLILQAALSTNPSHLIPTPAPHGFSQTENSMKN